MEERLQNFMKMLHKVDMEYRDIIREGYELAKQLLWEDALKQTKEHGAVQSVDVMEKAATLLLAVYNRERAEMIENLEKRRGTL